MICSTCGVYSFGQITYVSCRRAHTVGPGREGTVSRTLTEFHVSKSREFTLRRLSFLFFLFVASNVLSELQRFNERGVRVAEAFLSVFFLVYRFERALRAPTIDPTSGAFA